jgi:hypothetical protein
MAGLIPNQTHDLIPTVNVGTTDFMDPTGRVQVKQPNYEPMARAALYFQQKQNEAKIERARGDLERYITESTYGVPGEDGKPQGGWRQLYGEKACTPDEDGKGLAQRVDEGLEAAKRQYTQGFTPEMLKQFEDRYYINRRNQVYNSASAFVLEQNNAWKKSSAEGNIAIGVNGMIKSVNDPASFEANQKLADSNAYFYAREYLGLDEAAAQIYAREQVSKGAAGAITNILADLQNDPRGIADAQRFLKEHGDLMTASDLVRMRNLVDQEANKISDTKMVDGVARSITRDTQIFGHNGMPPYKLGTAEHAFGVCVGMESGGHQLDTKTGQVLVGRYRDGSVPKDQSKWSYGAAQMQVGTAQETAKRNGVAWDKDKFLTDRDYNIELGLLHYNHLVRQFGGQLELATAAYHAGEGAVKNALTQAAKKGGSYLDYLGPHSRDYVAKFRERFSSAIMKSGSGGALFDPARFQKYGEYASRKQVEDKVLVQDPRASFDIAHRNNITDRAYAELEKQRQSDMRERENGGAAILNWCFENSFDIDSVPFQLKNRVTPSDFAEIALKVKAFRNNDKSGDRDLYTKYMTNDKALLELSDAGYTLVRAAVPGDVRQALDDQRARLKEKDAMAHQQLALDVRDAQVGKFKPDYEVSTERLTQSFKEVFGAKEWKDLDENKRMDMLAMSRGFIAEQLQVLAKQGKEIGANTLNDLTKQFLSHEYDSNNIIMPDSKKNFAQLSAKDANTTKRGNLYSVGKQLAKLNRERLGLPNTDPSQGEIYEALVNLDTRKYTNLQGFSFDGFSQPRLDYVRKTFKWLYHREPDALETLKWYTRSLWKKEKIYGEEAEAAPTPLNNTFDRIGND